MSYFFIHWSKGEKYYRPWKRKERCQLLKVWVYLFNLVVSSKTINFQKVFQIEEHE